MKKEQEAAVKIQKVRPLSQHDPPSASVYSDSVLLRAPGVSGGSYSQDIASQERHCQGLVMIIDLQMPPLRSGTLTTLLPPLLFVLFLAVILLRFSVLTISFLLLSFYMVTCTPPFPYSAVVWLCNRTVDDELFQRSRSEYILLTHATSL